MKNNDRRNFLKKLGLTVGAIAVGKDATKAFPLSKIVTAVQQHQEKTPVVAASGPEVDFRYAPGDWQSTYCFPDDPYKSLVGKHGELLYGHPGLDAEWNAFAHIVSVGLHGKEPGVYVTQKLESPAIPVITTYLGWDDATIRLTSFATNDKDEGRIDNLLVEIFSKIKDELEVTPEISIASKEKFTFFSNDDTSTVQIAGAAPAVFFSVSSPVQSIEGNDVHTYQLKTDKAKKEKPLRFLLRFPQEKQVKDKIKYNVDDTDKLLENVRTFWQEWKPTDGKVVWKLNGASNDFLVACSRNIVESREIKNGKKIFQVGPTCYRGLWMVDGFSLLEAARYLGYDKEAQEGLESIWDRQSDNGAIIGAAGEKHYKDTAVAVYTLIRQAELSQNWEYFNELYPDAFKAIDYLRQLRDDAMNTNTANGKYGLLPQGFGDSGIDGVRSEFTNTIWALIALNKITNVAKQFKLERMPALNKFYGELRQAFYEAGKQERRKHPKGFSYLPMLMKDDPQWAEKDERKLPRIQAAQIYLTQACYPGLLFIPDDPFVGCNVDLMKAVTTTEDLPIETGWLSDHGVWPYNGAIVAQMYLWKGMSDLARKTFIAYLNHASPLFAWREEQSLLDVPVKRYIGDMPHNWASAECIRYLRHMLVLEDEKNLRLFEGIGLPEMQSAKPISLTYSPTKWGRVSVSLEPVDAKNWRTKFTREGFDEKTMPLFYNVEMPDKLPGGFWFDKITGATRAVNGHRVLIPGNFLSWECTWRSL